MGVLLSSNAGTFPVGAYLRDVRLGGLHGCALYTAGPLLRCVVRALAGAAGSATSLLRAAAGTVRAGRQFRRILATDEGRRLHYHCSRIAAELESAGLQTTQRRTSLRGKLRVSMPIDFGTGWISSAIASFAETYAMIDLDVHVNGRWVDVTEETYDIAIQLGSHVNPGVPARRLTALTRRIYASPKYLARLASPPDGSPT